jgi:hypothetical protein
MSKETIDRSALEKEAKNESAIADMKQHADKLIQGFEAEDKTHSRRAIWELVQNARDLSENCEITIELNAGNIKFTHNGKPFTPKTLLSLIKQVSSKSDDKLNEENQAKEIEEIGQYGTGFITTHAFGKDFQIDGSLQVSEGTYITLRQFEINRKAKSSKILAAQLVAQQNAVFELLAQAGNFTDEKLNTTFTYFFDEENEKVNAAEALNLFTKHYIPLVMSLNRRILSLRIINHSDNYDAIFEKIPEFDAGGVTVLPTKTGKDTVRNIYALQNKDLEMIVLLPLKDRYVAENWEKDTGRLFLHFPLIGTESWGGNYVIHCGKFSPTEKRDGLHLKSSKSQTKEKEENNRALLAEASALIFNFLKDNESFIANPIILAPAGFETNGENLLINEYYKELKEHWVKQLKTIKLVETDTELITAEQAGFYDRIFCSQPEYNDAIYTILNQFWKNIPKKDLNDEWTTIAADWEDESLLFITIADVAKMIEQEGSLDKFDQTVLIQFYKFLLSNSDSGLFDENKLLPNIKKEFTSKKSLHTADAIHQRFIEIADVIVEDIPKKFILKTFELTSDITPYSRKQISKDWNARFIEATKLITAENLLEVKFRNALISLCSTFPSLEKRGFRGDMMDLITDFYGQKADFIEIANIPDDEVEYDTPMKCLLKNFLYDIYCTAQKESSWVKENIILLNKILETITGHGTSAFEETIKLIPIFPDQNHNLRTQDALMLEEDMPDGLKELYDDVFHRDVKNELIHGSSVSFLPKLKSKNGSAIAVEINDHFEKQGLYSEILKHPSRVTINKIIKELTGKDGEIWMRLFPVISGKRETIMMSRVTKKEVKDSMFNILDLEEEPDKIVLLGDLAKDENMIRIIQIGKDFIAQEASDQSDFNFKHGIGTHIEQMLLKKIRSEMEGKQIEVKTLSKQDGQDIVIKYDDTDGNEQIIYFIEVKSRWSSGSVVSMSRNQIIQAVKMTKQYSLCVVDLIGYHPDDTSRHYPEDIALIDNRITAVTDIGKQLTPLIENAIKFETDVDAVKLTGEYRATIPVKVYSKGKSFNDFIDFLADELTKSLAAIPMIGT